MVKYCKFLHHTKIAYDLRVCKDLESRSFGQGHWQKKCKIRFRSISFLWRTIGSSYFTERLLMAGGRGVLTWINVIWPRSLAEKSAKSCSVHIFLMENQKFLLHTKIVYDLSVCQVFERKVIWSRAWSLTGKLRNLCLVCIFLCRNIRRS